MLDALHVACHHAFAARIAAWSDCANP
jgi:hypothetical protein